MRGSGLNTAADRAVVVVCTCLCIFFGVFCMIPLWVALVSSFTNENTLIREGYRLWISNFDLTSYRLIFTGTNDVVNAYAVTIITTIAGVTLTLLLTSSLAYPLTVPSLKYRNRIALFAYATMLFNGGLVPTYILISRFLHMRNTIWVLIVPGALNAYNMFLMRNFFAGIPASLSESAKIDGATDIRIYWSIILPLAKPIMATIGLFAAMGYWNEWYRVLLFIDRRGLFTLQFLIMRLQQQVDFLTSSLNPAARSALSAVTVPTIGIRLATAMISIGPIVLLYPLLQRYFIKGIMIGSVKG
ncbi:MAG: carbohydrate ABC transporter permease [Treponema sp.]|jgi:multiple sugar transport system permease protein/putative aldouronate transport system permease protein|nr:carbohydrate ABC transporter permease [Treponema sp.]